MDRFLQAYDLLKLNQAYINKIDRSTEVNKNETGIKSILTKKIPKPDVFAADLYKSSKKS